MGSTFGSASFKDWYAESSFASESRGAAPVPVQGSLLLARLTLLGFLLHGVLGLRSNNSTALGLEYLLSDRSCTSSSIAGGGFRSLRRLMPSESLRLCSLVDSYLKTLAASGPSKDLARLRNACLPASAGSSKAAELDRHPMGQPTVFVQKIRDAPFRHGLKT